MTLFYDFNDNEFEFELDWEKQKRAISHIASKFAKSIKVREHETDENTTKAIIESFIYDSNLEDEVLEQNQEELEDYFYDEAQQRYAETMQDRAELESMNYDYLHSRI